MRYIFFHVNLIICTFQFCVYLFIYLFIYLYMYLFIYVLIYFFLFIYLSGVFCLFVDIYCYIYLIIFFHLVSFNFGVTCISTIFCSRTVILQLLVVQVVWFLLQFLCLRCIARSAYVFN